MKDKVAKLQTELRLVFRLRINFVFGATRVKMYRHSMTELLLLRFVLPEWQECHLIAASSAVSVIFDKNGKSKISHL